MKKLLLVSLFLLGCGGGTETKIIEIENPPVVEPVIKGSIALTIDDGVSLPFLIDSVEIFERYEATATFYMSHYNEKYNEDLLHLQNKGFEIGHHSRYHKSAPEEVENTSMAIWLQDEVLNTLSRMTGSGIEIDTFAYPFGHYTLETNEALKPYFSKVRGFGGTRLGDYSEGFHNDGYFYFGVSVDSAWLDRMSLMMAMDRANETGETLVVGMHVISNEWQNDYKITLADLEFIIKYASEIGLEFKLMKDI